MRSRVWAATWGLAGALFGAIGGMADAGNPCTAGMTRAECVDASNRFVNNRIAQGAAGGVVVGAAFGVLFRRRERWQAATLPMRVALTLPLQQERRAVGFAVGVSW